MAMTKGDWMLLFVLIAFVWVVRYSIAPGGTPNALMTELFV